MHPLVLRLATTTTTLALVAGVAHAETPPTVGTAATATVLVANAAAAGAAQQRMEITAPPLRSDDCAAARGRYLLSDGRVLEVSGRRTRPTADLGETVSVPLVATSATSFVSADGALKLDFAATPNGIVTRVALSEARR